MKKYPFYFSMVFVLLTLSFFIFYQARLRFFSNPGLGVVKVESPAEGEVIITYSNPGRRKEILRAVVLNQLTVEGYELGVISIEGEKKPVLNLKTSFTYQNRERKLTIPIVDTVSLQKRVDEVFEDKGEINVANLELKKGSIVNIALSYIPIDAAVEKDAVISFCNTRDYEVCLRYIELGFGDMPIDFNKYLDQTLDGTQTIDYKVVFPVFISLL